MIWLNFEKWHYKRYFVFGRGCLGTRIFLFRRLWTPIILLNRIEVINDNFADDL